MSVTSDAITKIKANRALLSSKANAFKFSGLKVANVGATYNEAYLESKFSPTKKLNIEQRVSSEKQKQRIFNWILFGLILFGTYYFYLVLSSPTITFI